MAITTNGKVSITNLQVGSSADLAGIISDESGTGVLAFTNSPTFTTPALGTPSALVLTNATGTPSSITLTNGTGLPVSGISASTSAAIGVGTIELGHASDTTLSRSSAGVLAVEGNAVYTSGGALGTPSSATLTNATGLPISGLTASTSTALGVGSIELGHATDTTIARSSAGIVTIEGAEVTTNSGAQTLTNKTLTSPVLGGTTTTASGNLAVLPATYILEVQGGGSTEGAVQLNCAVNSHGQKIKSQPHAQSATNTLLLPGGTTIGNSDAVLVSDTGTQTLTNKTLSGGNIANSIIKGLEEDVNVVASAATGTINFDVDTASIWYYTSNATANFTLNFRFSSSVSLNTALATGDAITLVFLNTNGATAYYPSAITIDGNAVTPKVPAAISSGNASAIDAYSFTIIKTASATFTVLETQTKFA